MIPAVFDQIVVIKRDAMVCIFFIEQQTVNRNV